MAVDLPKSTAVVRGASILIILQIVSRATTFVANQLLLRLLTAELLGISTQLEVFYLSVVFFSRESLRVAVQRQDAPAPAPAQQVTRRDQHDHDHDRERTTSQSCINLAYLSLLAGVPLTVIFGSAYLGALDPSVRAHTPYLVPSLSLYAASALLELASEPAFIVLQMRLRFSTRGRAESLSTFTRCLLTLGAAFYGSRRGTVLGVLPFAVGQIGFVVVLVGTYLLDAYRLSRVEGFSLLPTRLASFRHNHHDGRYVLGYFYKPALHLAKSMVVQSGVKYILTQGDTLLVSVLSTPEALGVHALVGNYGGLLARLVFQPVEESTRSYFSRLLSGIHEQPLSAAPTTGQQRERKKPNGKDVHSEQNHRRDKMLVNNANYSKKEENNDPLPTALSSLLTLLRFYALASLPILSLLPAASHPLLSLIAGPRWTSPSSSPSPSAASAAHALAAYALYIPLLAANGIAESFVSSVASEPEIHAQSIAMVFFTAAFASSGFAALRVFHWGATGLVLANGVNMVCRICWSACFIRGWFARRGLRVAWGDVARTALPGHVAVAAAVVAAAAVGRVAGDGTRTKQWGAREGEGEGESVKHNLVELVKVAGCAVPLCGVL